MRSIIRNIYFRNELRRMAYELFGTNMDEDIPMPAVSGSVRQEVKPPDDTLSCLSAGTEFVGTMKAEGGAEIHGKFDGDIISGGDVLLCCHLHGNVSARRLELRGGTMDGDASVGDRMVIDAQSAVTGHLLVHSLLCDGAVNGDTQAAGDAMLGSTARITGDLSAAAMTAARGCTINGTVTID